MRAIGVSAALFGWACSPSDLPGGSPGTSSGDSPASTSMIDGPPEEPAMGYVPERPFEPPTTKDFGQNPYLGIETSRRHLYVGLREDATLGEVNDALGSVVAALGGTIPQVGILQLVLPEGATFDDLNVAVETLAKHPAVDIVTEDIPIQPSTLPRSPPNIQQKTVSDCGTINWTWGSAGNHNWGLELVHAPNAWNLNKAIERADNDIPVVAIQDLSFVPHVDLEGILEVVASDVGAKMFLGRGHGTSVAGVIGAHFDDGRYLDGIAPRVRMVGLTRRSIEDYTIGVGQQIYDFGQYLMEMSPRPRVINISLGLYFHCDPRDAANNASPCENGSAVLNRIESAGRLTARVVRLANSDNRPVLFVEAAGNWAEAHPGYPAELSSPHGWVAKNEPTLAEHIIVVEALKRKSTSDWQAERDVYSNVNGDVFAPGSRIALLEEFRGPIVCVRDGTSFAAPLVAGAAAFLLSIDPGLSNSQLKQLLTQAPYAASVTGEDAGGSSTRTRLDLFSAVLGIDVLRKNQRVKTMLADFDDGSSDGCQRSRYNEACQPADAYATDSLGDGMVNMRDFRRFRDALLLAQGNGSALDGTTDSLKRGDLNQNGAVETPAQEIFARANLNGDEVISLDRVSPLPGFSTPVTDLDVFKSVYAGDAVQNWPKERLQVLLKSADLVIRAQTMIDAHNAGLSASDPQRVAAIDITIKGEPHPSDGLPEDLACADSNLDGEPDDPSDVDCAALFHLQVGRDDVVLTTPFRSSPRIEWRFVRCMTASAGGEAACTGDSARFVLPLLGLNPGEDRVVDIVPSLGVNRAAGPLTAVRECNYSPGLCSCGPCSGSVTVFPFGRSLPVGCSGTAGTPSTDCPFSLTWACSPDDADCTFSNASAVQTTMNYSSSPYSLVVGPETCNDPTGSIYTTIVATTQSGCPATMSSAPISYTCLSIE